MKPLHPCGNPACPELVSTARCPTHTITREERNPRDPEQIRFYGSRQWKQLRLWVRRRDPICKMCYRQPSTTVDHIDGDWRNNNPANLRGLCDTCHRTHSGREHFKKRTA